MTVNFGTVNIVTVKVVVKCKKYDSSSDSSESDDDCDTPILNTL